MFSGVSLAYPLDARQKKNAGAPSRITGFLEISLKNFIKNREHLARDSFPRQASRNFRREFHGTFPNA
jgi:hypothetical protein